VAGGVAKVGLRVLEMALQLLVGVSLGDLLSKVLREQSRVRMMVLIHLILQSSNSIRRILCLI
jgi:hypothetical protein